MIILQYNNTNIPNNIVDEIIIFLKKQISNFKKEHINKISILQDNKFLIKLFNDNITVNKLNNENSFSMKIFPKNNLHTYLNTNNSIIFENHIEGGMNKQDEQTYNDQNIESENVKITENNPTNIEVLSTETHNEENSSDIVNEEEDEINNTEEFNEEEDEINNTEEFNEEEDEINNTEEFNELLEINPNHDSLLIKMNNNKYTFISSKDNYSVINKKDKQTSHFMTKYEKTRILCVRAQQLVNGSHSMVEVPVHKQNDIEYIVQKELEEKKIPLIIRRFLPSGEYEDWKTCDLICL